MVQGRTTHTLRRTAAVCCAAAKRVASNAAKLTCGVAVILLCLAGCASQWVSLRAMPSNPLIEELHLASWSGPKPSPRTMQVLRVYNLADDIEGDTRAPCWQNCSKRRTTTQRQTRSMPWPSFRISVDCTGRSQRPKHVRIWTFMARPCFIRTTIFLTTATQQSATRTIRISAELATCTTRLWKLPYGWPTRMASSAPARLPQSTRRPVHGMSTAFSAAASGLRTISTILSSPPTTKCMACATNISRMAWVCH